MHNIDKALMEFREISENPGRQVSDYIEKTRNKAIGCFPGYCPEELVYSAKMLPVGLWGGNVQIFHAKKYLPAFFCPLIQQCMELGLRGSYDNLSGVIIPGLCDTLKSVGQNWKVAIPDIRFIPLMYPQNRKQDFGIDFLVSEYKDVLKKLEEISGHTISDEDLKKSIEIYNRNRAVLRKFVDIAGDYPEIITPLIRNYVIKSGYFIDRRQHTNMLEELVMRLEKLEKSDGYGKRVILTGVIMDNQEVLEQFSDLNIIIAGDDLLHESRQFRTDTPLDNDNPLICLANRWKNMDNCSLIMNSKKERADMIVDMVRDKRADGVVFCMTTFCDPEEYDYPFLRNKLDDEGISNIIIEINDNDSIGQIKTKLQTYAEILQG
jgi:bcr-type benzoyl-CoA reductase subunit C